MSAPRLRIAARALLIDPDDRLLLVRFQFSDRAVWAMPGGGLDVGETHVDALRRELHEEIGCVDAEIGPPIWTRTHLFALSDAFDGQSETIFLVRVESTTFGPALLTDEQLRAEYVFERAWWTLPQLLASDLTFSPRRLPTLVADLLASGPPDAPIDVGI